MFCFDLFCFDLFCFVLFCFVLFCFVLFCFVLFCFVCLCLFGCFTGGYTPAECAVLGVPSITSNLAGFGSYVEKHVENTAKNGIYVTDRIGQTWEQAAQQMAEILNNFTMMSRRQRIEMRNRVERLGSTHLDWRSLGRHYFTARSMALERHANSKLQPSSSYENLRDLEFCEFAEFVELRFGVCLFADFLSCFWVWFLSRIAHVEIDLKKKEKIKILAPNILNQLCGTKSKQEQRFV